MEHLSFVLLLLLLLAPLAFGRHTHLQVGFYRSTCPRAESIVKDVVRTHFIKDPSVTPLLLRMHFHDCFSGGCDASLLIGSSNDANSEKSAFANAGVGGFKTMDEAKEKLEAECPSVVSCADIIALATRDALALAGGLNYNVPTGRRDALVTNVTAADDLPGPFIEIPEAIHKFKAKGFSPEEMVTLLGAHTVGVAHCLFIMDRIMSLTVPMELTLWVELIETCGGGDINPKMFLDQNTSFVVDNEVYKQILLNKGVLDIDQKLALDDSTRGFVSAFASDGNSFLRKFAAAMVKLGTVGVLVGDQGNVRTNCRAFNVKPPPVKKHFNVKPPVKKHA